MGMKAGVTLPSLACVDLSMDVVGRNWNAGAAVFG